MKKASVLIIASVLLAALLCLAGCGSSSSGEDTSSDSATTENSDSESNGDNASDDSSSSGSEGSASESDDDESADKSTTKKYTDKEIGLTVSLPGSWEESSDLEADNCFLFLYYDKRTSDEYIYAKKFSVPDDDGVKITDFSKDYITDFYSDTMSVDSVKKKKLNSGTYYQIKAKGLDNDNYYYVVYEITKNGYDIEYTYASYGGNSDRTPHLSDFEDMVNNAKYK